MKEELFKGIKSYYRPYIFSIFLTKPKVILSLNSKNKGAEGKKTTTFTYLLMTFKLMFTRKNLK